MQKKLKKPLLHELTELRVSKDAHKGKAGVERVPSPKKIHNPMDPTPEHFQPVGCDSPK
jgi:hypothetical protein